MGLLYLWPLRPVVSSQVAPAEVVIPTPMDVADLHFPDLDDLCNADRPLLQLGEFLVARGYITADQLLDALIDQAEAQPSALRVLREAGGLDANAVVSLAGALGDDATSLLKIAQSSAMIDGETMDKLLGALRATRSPLGQILRSKTDNPMNMMAWLAEYQEYRSKAKGRHFE